MTDDLKDGAYWDSGEPEKRVNRRILDLPVEISVCVGEVHLTVRQLMDLAPEAILSLKAKVVDPVNLYVGERLVARGELVEDDGNPDGMAVRVVSLVGSDEDR
jgi:flagellar motor switch protein FliN/FliY